MALSPNSPELKLENGLRELDCSGRNFVEIARLMHIKISNSRFAEALNANRRIEEPTMQTLLDLLEELKQVRGLLASLNPLPIPLDFSRHEAITTFVLSVRLKQIEKESNQ